MKGPWAVRMAAAMVCLASGAMAFSANSPKPHVILVTQQKGFIHDAATRHAGRPSLVESTLAQLAQQSGQFDLVTIDDVTRLPARLKDAKVVIFYTTGELPFTDDALAKLDKWVKDGGAILGIHGATDTLRLNATWHNLVGATYDGHPWNATDYVTFKVHDKTFPVCQSFGDTFTLAEEIDQQKGYDPKQVHELISVDMERTAKKRPIHIPVAWCRQYEKGKLFYTNLGHNPSVWENPAYQHHLLGALEWLLGTKPADAKPNPEVSAREDEIIKKLAIPAPSLPAIGEGLTISTFAEAPQFHSPSSGCVSADGRVFVGEDEYNTGNDRKMGLCRVKMLADTDGDGRADKVTIFADKICAPQGMTFVGDTLFVVNAPFLTAFRDTNGDGVADTREDLITGFGPVPEGLVHHIPSGVHMGIDGFLYITVGDKGIVHASGKDGRTVRLLGGGVVRIRPDGSEMELFSSGNRNPYSAAVDPYMNIFMRDNTNDGGGWNSRLSQMQRGAEYGYPRLFTNFGDEIIPCIADYGGGGATGSVYVKEPSLPAPYGDSLYTIDWGRSFVYRHNLTPTGATFKPDQEEFVFGSFPTSIDVDARGRIYVVNWGRLSWGEAPPIGSVYRIQSEDWNAPPLPNMSSLSDSTLVRQITSTSAVTRREAQWEILKRNRRNMAPRLLDIARSTGPLDSRVAALFTYAQLQGPAAMPGLAELWQDKALREFALRAMADRPNFAPYANGAIYAASMRDPNPRVRTQAAIAIGKSNRPDLAQYLLTATADPDIMARHAAMQSLRQLNAVDTCLAALDTQHNADVIAGILRTLRGMHDPRVVHALSQFIPTATPALKKESLKTLERLYTVEAEWDGSWWLTRPDTRGPNYKPARWDQSTQVGNLFITLLNDPNPDVAKSALAAIGLVRAQEAAPALAQLVKAGGPLKVDAVRALIEMKDASPEAIAAIETVITSQGWDDALVNDAVGVLGSMDQPAAQDALVRVLKSLDAQDKPRPALLDRAADALASRAAADQRVAPTADLLTAKTPSVRIAAATSLARSNDPAAKQRVAQLWQSSDPSQLEALLAAITRIPADAAKAHAAQVQSLLKDPRQPVRHAAISALSRTADPAVAVTDLLASAKSWKDRDVAAKALADIDPAKVPNDQFLKVTGILAETAASLAKSPDKDTYGRLLGAAQKYLADARVPREKAAEWIKELKQTGVLAEYAKTDPIPVEAGKAFTAILPPDQNPAGPFATFPAGGKPVDWKHIVVTDPTGVLPLSMPANTVTYLNTTYDAGAGGAALLTAGSDDGLQIWLNGKKVISSDANRPTKADQDRAVVQLLAGTNVLLLRVNNNAGDAGVQARIRQRVTDFEPAELEQLAKEIPGDPKRGRAVFEAVGCVKCHATDPHEEAKGPYLGDAGAKFQPGHIIESILRPSAKIAQGFTTVKVTAKADGGGTTEYLGWVTKEGSDEVAMRDAAGQTYTLPKSKILTRTPQPQSMMPEGLLNTTTLEDVSSLLSYLQSLNAKP